MQAIVETTSGVVCSPWVVLYNLYVGGRGPASIPVWTVVYLIVVTQSSLKLCKTHT